MVMDLNRKTAVRSLVLIGCKDDFSFSIFALSDVEIEVKTLC